MSEGPELIDISPPSSPTTGAARASGSGRTRTRAGGSRDATSAAGDGAAGDGAAGEGGETGASGSGRSFTRPPTERRKTSAVWDHYEVCEDDSSKAKCKHCDKKVGAFSFALPCFGGEN